MALDDSLESGRGRFQVGNPGSAGFAGPSKSVFEPAATVSVDRRYFWTAICIFSSRTRGGNFLRHQLSPPRFRSDKAWLPSVADLPCLPLLGGYFDSSVAPPHHGGRFPSVSSAGGPRKTTAGIAGSAHQFEPAWCPGLRFSFIHKSRNYAAVASLLDLKHSHYDRFIPLLVFPGPLLALALLRYRDRDAHLFLLMAIMPQRWFYDTFILWLIPKTRRQILWTVFFSWFVGIWRWYHMPHSFTQVGRWTVLFIYFPVLWTIISRPKDAVQTGSEGHGG